MKDDEADGLIAMSGLSAVWQECDTLYSRKAVDATEVANHADQLKAFEQVNLLCKYEYEDYNTPSAALLQWVANNYKRQLYLTHNLKGVKCRINTPGDPLLKTNHKGEVEEKEKERYVLTDLTKGEYEKVTHDDDLSVKTFARAWRLYSTAEKLAGNLANESKEGKVFYCNSVELLLTTLIQRSLPSRVLIYLLILMSLLNLHDRSKTTAPVVLRRECDLHRVSLILIH